MSELRRYRLLRTGVVLAVAGLVLDSLHVSWGGVLVVGAVCVGLFVLFSVSKD